MSGTRDPHEPLSALPLSARARRVCEALGVETVGELRAHTGEEILAVPGCGAKTRDELVRAVEAAPGQTGLPVAAGLGAVPLLELLQDRRAERAFLTLGITTVADLLETPAERLMATPGFGEASYRRVMEVVERLGSSPSPDLDLLPAPLLQFPLAEVGLGEPVRRRLERLGMATIGDVLAWPPEFWKPGFPGAAAAGDLRAGLDRLVRVGLEQVVATTGDPATSLTDTLLQALPNDHRDHLRRRLGLGVPPVPLSEMAGRSAEDMRELLQTERMIRRTLEERAAGPLCRLRDEIFRELQAFEGVVTGDHLAPGTLAHAVAKETGYPLLPLRIVAFCFPRHFHLHEGCLLSLPSATFRRFLERLRELTGPEQLPVRLEKLSEDLSSIVEPVPHGLLQHLLENACKLTVLINERDGEVATRRPDSVGSRLQRILAEARRPTRLLDLVFHYRDHHRHARKDRLLSHLRRDKTFLEVGKDLWSLREWHQEDLDMAFTEADRAAQAIVSLGGRHDVRRVLKGEATERVVYVVIDCLRRDPRVRYLGRGEFCPASSSRSAVLEDLARDFRRAMGEVPLSRFIANAPQERRRLITSLLHENRLFVEPAPDRVDLLTNYPFNTERLHALLGTVGGILSRRRGYVCAEDMLQELEQVELGGSWLGAHMLRDLLRRHGCFELLPGGLVAQASLGLGGWIQARAREAIRASGMPMTADEITAEVPELAEFSEALEQMLGQDPLLQTADGVYFRAV